MNEGKALTSEEVYGWFREVLEKSLREYKDNVIHVSEAVGCLRKAYYTRKNPIPIIESKAVTLVMGNGAHSQLQELLAGKGFQVEMLLEVDLRDFKLVGHADLYDPERNIIVELKTSRKLPDSPYESHVLQLNAYMFMGKVKKGYLVYIAKSSSKIKVFPHFKDLIMWKRVLARARSLYNFLRLEKPPKPEPSWLCNYCEYKWRCYEVREG